MIEFPRTLSEVESLVRNRVPEDLHLDYKRSEAIGHDQKAEIVKDVSAFMNSDGGVLIYGVVEDKAEHVPVRIDDGVDERSFGREWFERVLVSNIQPRIDRVEIVPIPLSGARCLYVIGVPRTNGVPFQNAIDKRYYKRFNFTSHPMEHYEIEDIRNRRLAIRGRLSVGIETQGILISFVISNESDVPLRDIAFVMPPELAPWLESKQPNFFTRGIRELGPNRRIAITWGSYIGLTQSGSSNPQSFDIVALYRAMNSEDIVTDTFHVDLIDYWNTRVERSELERHSEKLEKVLGKLVDEVQKIGSRTEQLAAIAESTGLNLSITALRNLRGVLMGADLPAQKIDPEHYDADAFVEVLGVSWDTAFNLRRFFSGQGPASLEQVEGLTPELCVEVRRWFQVISQAMSVTSE